MDIKLPARLKQLKDSVQEFLDQDSCSDRVDGPQSAKGAENGWSHHWDHQSNATENAQLCPFLYYTLQQPRELRLMGI